MKRLTSFFLLFIIVFTISSSFIYASNSNQESNSSESSTDFSGWDSWSLSDKARYVTAHIGLIAEGVSNFVIPNGMSYTQACEKLFLDNYLTSNYSSYGEMLADNISYNSSTDSLVLNDLALQFLNDLVDSIKEQKTYQYGYFCPVESLDATSFDLKEEYDIIHNVIQSKPDYAFSIWKSGITLKDSNGGNRIYSAWNIKFLKVPYAGVGGTGGSITTSKTTLFDDNWESSIDSMEFYVLANDIYNDYPPGGYDAGDIFYNNGSEFVGLHDVSLSDFDLDLCPKSTNGYSIFLGISNNYFDTPVHPSANYMFSAFAGGIPIFKSVADMKTGTTGKQVLQSMPGYTGQPITKNTITQQEINDFSTNYNYYYGDNSGNNPGGGSGSGSGSGSSGNWLESLLSSLGKLGDIIMTLFSKVFDIITDILKFFTDTLADVMDIIPEGFIGFLGAFFPFIPKEWLTAVSLLLALTLIGAIIKFFKK